MLSWPAGTVAYVATRPADMRWGFDTLARQVAAWLGRDPLSGHPYVFVNRRGDRVKILLWEPDGYLLISKRLEAGTVRLPPADADGRLTLSAEDLLLALRGIDPSTVRRAKRFHQPPTRI
jgi:transposase